MGLFDNVSAPNNEIIEEDSLFKKIFRIELAPSVACKIEKLASKKGETAVEFIERAIAEKSSEAEKQNRVTISQKFTIISGGRLYNYKNFIEFLNQAGEKTIKRNHVHRKFESIEDCVSARANDIIEILTARGVSADRIIFNSRGEEKQFYINK